MKDRVNHLIKILIYTLIFCFIVTYIVSTKTPHINWMYVIIISVAFSLLITLIYEKYLWKYFSDFPNINGKYIAIFKSDFKVVKEIKLHIKQTYLTLNIQLENNETTSRSITGEIVYEYGKYILYYSYITDPEIEFSEEFPVNRATARIVFEENRLIGNYWTSKQTNGDIYLKKQ
nr:hypothetical protein [Mammaliicoccus sp. Marseille-Q6498]